jgi:hypothetical protein
MTFLPMGVVPDKIVGNELTVVDETVVDEAVAPEARVIMVAPNTFQANSHVLFSLNVLGLAVRPKMTGERVE